MAPSRRLRRSLIILGFLGVVLVGLAVALPYLVDVERYRPWIATKVREATGRKVSLGPISLRLLPRPALTVGPVAVSEGERYPDRDALRLRRLSVRLGLAGLLRGEVAIGSIVLDGPVLNLIRDSRGRWNYDDLLDQDSVERAPGEARPGPAPTAVSVQRATVRSGRILLYDDTIIPGSRAELEIGPIDGTIRDWGAGRETLVDLAVGLGESVLRAEARIETSGEESRADLKVDSPNLRAEDLIDLLPWLGVVRPAGLEVSGRVDLTGETTVPLERPGAIRFHGSVRLDDLSYQDASLAAPLSGISGQIQVDGDHAVWEGFTARTGSSSIKGSLRIRDFMRPRVGFALISPRIDFNEILATINPAEGSQGATTVRRDEASPAAGGFLDQITAQGTLALDEVRFQGFELGRVRTSVGLKGGVLSLEDLEATFYEGSLAGSMDLDISLDPPRYRLAVEMSGVAVEPALAAYDSELEGLLRGRLSGTLGMEAGGRDMDDITASAGGSGSLEISDGALTSFSALAQVATLLELAGGKGIGRDETPFEYFRGTYAIGGGNARTSDLTLHSADLDLDGEGRLGLDASMDLAVVARFSEEATRGMAAKNPRIESFTDPSGRLIVHLHVSGDLEDPRVSLDTRAQTRQLGDKEKERLKEKLKDRLRGLLGGDQEDDEEEH